jgi:hypothetical protein
MSCPCLTEAAAKLTGCSCDGAGFCARHQCTKTEHYHSLCKRDPRYFALWESGRGPCLPSPGIDSPVPGSGSPPAAPGKLSPVGLGDAVAWFIFWITLGKMRPSSGCRCERRKAWLNQITLWGWWR